MELLDIFKYLSALAAVAIIVTVLLQVRSGGVGSVFGGVGGESYRSKRGTEALMYNLTIVFAIIFAFSAFAVAVLS